MIARFLAAVRFLTIVPVPGHLGVGEEALAKSLIFFPVVGGAIGLLVALLGWVAWPLLPALPAAVVMVSVLLALSGGFHLDGLADACDGLFSARPREEVLRIMRDSHIGTMGVVALIMVLLLKTAALASLPRDEAVAALFLMPLAGRCLMVFMMALLPYVRGEEGRAALFYERASEKKVVYVTGALLYSGCWYAGGGIGLAAGAVALVMLLGFAGLCRARIGGATGDTLGAICELTEAMVGLVLASGW